MRLIFYFHTPDLDVFENARTSNEPCIHINHHHHRNHGIEMLFSYVLTVYYYNLTPANCTDI